jgi:putative sigma-54 modulation protein
MDLTISSQHTTLTEPIKEYAEKKLGKLDERFSFPVKVTLRIRKEGTKREEDRYIAEVTVPLKRGFIRSEERADSPYTAIDLVQNNVERRIRRYKTRFHKRRREPNGLEAEIADQLAATIASDEDEKEEVMELEFGQVVRTKKHDMAPLSVQEATAQMDLLGHNFYMFKNRDNGVINVVYRRHDDDYGLIIPAEETA